MKRFLIVIATLISILIAYIFIKDWLDNRPLKFESYKNREEFNTVLKTQFPLGSDIREMMKLFEQSGARCKDRSGEEDMSHDMKKYDIIYWCEYESGWLSLPPFQVYEIWFMGDKNHKLIEIFGSTYTGFVI
ncbi:hypothetical protein NOVO_09115 (plasmid) [Rickettsiales bacterium Ac37b]|nr:hypothetical protein NOVO_09115 [Rickettsiales bacterium Ac37b]